MTVTKTEGREKPILFQGWSVRSILERTKIQTRRIIKPQPNHANQRYDLPEWEMWGNGYPDHGQRVKCPYGVPGSRLWVRESFWHRTFTEGVDDGEGYAFYPPGGKLYLYCATDDPPSGNCAELYTKRPSIHMPRDASRITLEITDVRVEQVRNISAHDAYKEGIHALYDDLEDASRCIDRFRQIWNDINAKPRPVKRSGGVVGWVSYPWSLPTFLERYGGKVHQFEEGAWSYRPGRPKSPVVEEEFLPLAIHDNPWVWVVEFKVGSSSRSSKEARHD